MRGLWVSNNSKFGNVEFWQPTSLINIAKLNCRISGLKHNQVAEYRIGKLEICIYNINYVSSHEH